MTITARNYAAQAQRALREMLPHLHAKGEPDAPSYDQLAGLIAEAQHFALPDNAEVFENGLRGLVGVQARLPYPVVTLEYFVPPDTLLHAEAPLYASRILVVATEVPGVGEQADILIFSMYFARDAWIANPAGFLLSGGWDRYGASAMMPNLVEPRADVPPMVGTVIPFMPHAVRGLEREHGADNVKRSLAHDITREAYAVLSFCEALTCSNVATTVLSSAPPAVNAKRLRAGKLPMLETKVLTVQVPGSASVRIGTGDKTGDVRQHLRRGHIRRIADDRRVWVNSCVVGNPARGRVEKTYRVQPEAMVA